MLLYQEQHLKISGLYDENCVPGMHLKFMSHPHNNDSEVVKGITSDNKLMNLYEIGLSHIVFGVSKVNRDNHEIWWKCFMSKIYLYIWILGYGGGRTYSNVHFLFIIKKKGKGTRTWPILKPNSTSFWFNVFFLGWIIKILQKGGPRPYLGLGLNSYFFTNWVW